VNRLYPALLSLALGLAACATDATDVDSSSAAAITATTSIYRVESIVDGAIKLSLANGGVFTCPGVASEGGKRCTVAKLVLPADCGWECTDGLLSLRGVTLLEGTLDKVFDAAANKKLARLVVTAGWDTWRPGPGPFQYYRLTPASPTCEASPCPGELRAKRLNGSEPAKTVTRVDFSKADDTNYVLDPTRGTAQAASAAGLLASGVIKNGVFQADRVLRLWTPKPACDPQLVARAHWLTGGEDYLDVELDTIFEAERYQDDTGLGRSVHWLVRDAEDALAVEYVAGVNDLWAERIGIDKATCEITVLAEH
jgi:hypothetical protein